MRDSTSITAEDLGGVGFPGASWEPPGEVFSTTDGSTAVSASFSALFGILSLAMALGAVNPSATRPRTSGLGRRETMDPVWARARPRRATAAATRRDDDDDDDGPGTLPRRLVKMGATP